jgi:hypothetical protein
MNERNVDNHWPVQIPVLVVVRDHFGDVTKHLQRQIHSDLKLEVLYDVG